MFDTPTPEQLLAAVAQWLRAELLPTLAGAPAYQARVAAGLLDTVARQLAQAPGADAAERARLLALLPAVAADPAAAPADPPPLDALNRQLADAIAQGRLGLATPGLAAHLWSTTLDKLAVDQPGYDGARRAPDLPIT